MLKSILPKNEQEELIELRTKMGILNRYLKEKQYISKEDILLILGYETVKKQPVGYNPLETGRVHE